MSEITEERRENTRDEYSGNEADEKEGNKGSWLGSRFKGAVDAVKNSTLGRWVDGASGTLYEIGKGLGKKWGEDLVSGRAQEEQRMKNLWEELKRLAVNMLFLLKDSLLQEQASARIMLTDKRLESVKEHDTAQHPAAKTALKTQDGPKGRRISREELDSSIARRATGTGITTAAKTAVKAAKDIREQMTK